MPYFYGLVRKFGHFWSLSVTLDLFLISECRHLRFQDTVRTDGGINLTSKNRCIHGMPLTRGIALFSRSSWKRTSAKTLKWFVMPRVVQSRRNVSHDLQELISKDLARNLTLETEKWRLSICKVRARENWVDRENWKIRSKEERSCALVILANKFWILRKKYKINLYI